jgi:hypothetical protein
MGQKYAAYNSSGAIIAFYDSVDSPVPSSVTSTLAITDAQWMACLTTPGYTVVSGSLVAPATPTDAQLLADAQASQIAILSASCAAAITDGFTSSALGSAYTYPAKATDQQNLTASVLASLMAISQAGTWVASTSYTAGTLIVANGSLYTCTISGPSGASAPTWPTVNGTTVTDGTAVWELWTTPFWCENSGGTWAWVNHNAAQIQQVGVDAKSAILSCMGQNAALAAQVAAATTIAAVQAIVWPSA